MGAKKHFMYLHLIVFIWGASGLVGDLIAVDTTGIVCYRMLIATVAIGLLAFFHKPSRIKELPPRTIAFVAFTGAILATHWWFFFAAIKASTVSIGLICLSSAPFFIALVEPALERTRVRFIEIILGICCMLSLAMIYQFETQYVTGIVLGLSCALADAFYSSLTKRVSHRVPTVTIAFYQMMGGGLALLAVGAIVQPDLQWLLLPDAPAVAGVLFLGVLCSAVAMIGYVECLKNLPTFTTILSLNMEPVYGILLALMVMGEEEYMSTGFYLGSLCLLGCIGLDIFWKTRRNKTVTAS